MTGDTQDTENKRDNLLMVEGRGGGRGKRSQIKRESLVI
jgi:hypothetical protein